MKKALLLLIILVGQVQVIWSQESVALNETLNFQSEAEKEFWNSGEGDPFSLFQAVKAESVNSTDQWTELVEELDLKASKKRNDLNFIRQVFEKTHKKLFNKYEQHSTFNQMLTEGKYDCVSGSAALSLLLERYNYQFDIVETDYHVFLVVNLDGKKIVLESTLPIGGMITSQTEVQKYLDSYKPAEFAQLKSYSQSLAGTEVEYNDNAIFRKVNLKQLAGLQYYNDAIVHFNAQEFTKAVDQLSKAYLLYSSERILGLRELSVDMAYKSYGYELKK